MRVRFSVLGKAVWTGATLVCSVVATAQQAVLLPVDAEQAQLLRNDTLAWVDQNRFLEVSVGQRRQDYRETDVSGLTGNGIFDTETGNQGQIGVAVRWQTAKDWLFQFGAQRQSGITDYNGYLQAGGGSLTPFRAGTGNVATKFTANFGYSFNSQTWNALHENWQVTPLIQLARHHWERNLVQYSETYDFNSYAMGALVQWQPRPGTVLEMQALVGRTQSAMVNVSDFGFFAKQLGRDLREFEIGIRQDLRSITGKETLAGWRIVARCTGNRYGHGSSPVINGLQAPANQHHPNTWALGLQKQF